MTGLTLVIGLVIFFRSATVSSMSEYWLAEKRDAEAALAFANRQLAVRDIPGIVGNVNTHPTLFDPPEVIAEAQIGLAGAGPDQRLQYEADFIALVAIEVEAGNVPYHVGMTALTNFRAYLDQL